MHTLWLFKCITEENPYIVNESICARMFTATLFKELLPPAEQKQKQNLNAH